VLDGGKSLSPREDEILARIPGQNMQFQITAAAWRIETSSDSAFHQIILVLVLIAGGLLTFEDRRKENFEKGQAELERRRALLREQQQKEEEARVAFEKAEHEKRERLRY